MNKYETMLMPYEVIDVFNTDTIPNGINMIKAPEFWNKEPTKGEKVKVAILDTGCDVNHPDLKGKIKMVRNFTTDDSGIKYLVTDNVGHGTHVAGIVAANYNNSGIVGVAPNVDLYIFKVLTNFGGTINWLVHAIEYCMFLNIDIINMSLGTTFNSPILHNTIKRAVNNGILVVCSAGNSGDGNEITNEISYPAAYNECIAVGAIDNNMNPSNFTNSNDNVDLVAPGVAITSTYPGGLYASLSGTSQAAPHVTGALSLIKNWGNEKFGRKLTSEEIYAQLIRKTLDLGDDSKFIGNGMIYLTADDELRETILGQ